MASFTTSHSLSFDFNASCCLRRQSIPQSHTVRNFRGHWLNYASSTSASCRIRNVQTRCSVADTDLRSSQGLADDELPRDSATLESDSSPPIVHLKTDILGTEPLRIVAEATYIDSLLTAIPVLSEEEQNVLAATPAHPVGLYALYASCLAGNLVEQLWNFAWPSVIALLYPSLLPVAIMSFFTKLVVIVGGPLVGKLMDNSPRVTTYISLNIVQAAAQLLSAAMIIHAYSISSTPSSSFILHVWFVVLVVAGAIERLCGQCLN